MFIAQSYLTSAPFGGAELKFTDTVQVYSAPPNGGIVFCCSRFYKHFTAI